MLSNISTVASIFALGALRNDQDRTRCQVAEPVSNRPENHSFRQSGATTANNEYVGLVDLANSYEATHGIA